MPGSLARLREGVGRYPVIPNAALSDLFLQMTNSRLDAAVVFGVIASCFEEVLWIVKQQPIQPLKLEASERKR